MSFQQGVGDGNQFKGIDSIRSGHDEVSFAFNRDDIIDKATAFLRDRFHGLGHSSWSSNFNRPPRMANKQPTADAYLW